MDAATFNSVTRGQFLKTIPVIVERQKAQAALPESARKLLGVGFVKQVGR